MPDNLGPGLALRKLALGFAVHRASAILPATTVQTPYWTVIGGRILLTGLYGIVTVLFDATATTVKFVANPTVGTDGDLCGASASTANKEVGALFALVGTALTTALATTNAASLGMAAAPLQVGIGTIDCLTANTNVGAARWTLLYVPIDDGAYVEVA